MPDLRQPIAIQGRIISTARLRLRPWTADDAHPALAVFGTDQVARWLAPAMHQVPDAEAMGELLRRWAAGTSGSGRAVGRWAIEQTDGQLIGAGAILPLPPHGEDLEIGWQLAPEAWGHGYAAEAGRALAQYAFTGGEEEVFAVVRPRNDRGAATARRVGMEWVGETTKYYDLRLQVYRLRKGELDLSLPAQR